MVVLARRHPGLDPVGVAPERRRARAEPPIAIVSGAATGWWAAAPGGWNIGSSRAIGSSVVRRSRTCRGSPAVRRRAGAKPSSSFARWRASPSRSRRPTTGRSRARFGWPMSRPNGAIARRTPFGIRSAGSCWPPSSAAISSASIEVGCSRRRGRTSGRSGRDRGRRRSPPPGRRRGPADPEVGRAPDVRQRAARGPAGAGRPTCGVVAGTDRPGSGIAIRTGAPAAIRCSRDLVGAVLRLVVPAQEALAEVAPVRLVDDPAVGVAERR